ncbi:sugar nucleotide-binding protein [Nocardioides sp. Kera G14]|uniref:sugar nucleotide-binding protein n=1 Tax=Nocardioides sp. Kera G14 TaxID=2884264 RepID=UPI001D111425|nr:bifunctional dTDP-4-dehydrorhamnose 3,5-epimerase family protein/NAD(P)-dependent oxidoreductase [Nocardioides sp. Kera G14]UDY23089.1 bifunctional dTDP-4-dehydrorhamnose 3,5-epimerase family protein/NAD(P)-dependent oxidoreductase [Nocardioides sp. Kera G14]
MNSTNEVKIDTTPIPGLLVVTLPVHGDARGWFKENWQRAKMTALGLPDFGPVQNNMSFNASRGATRGIHTEPWDKFVSVAFGRVFAAWVDMREGDSFRQTFSIEIGPETAVFVPRGVGNSYQALEDNTVYSYLVNDHWQPGPAYPALNLADPTAAIPWPIPLDSDEVEISEKDRNNPLLGDVTPMKPKKTLIIGAKGQLGRALAVVFPEAEQVDLDELDISSAAAVEAWPWSDYEVVLNAAAFTAVDLAETPEGRATSWAANAVAPALLARAATEHRLTLVHVSSDYVFDGTAASHTEDERLSPLGVYGQSKAAGDIAVATTPRHYILRTSWVIGEGKNFVRTMQTLAGNGVSPSVVSDQIGRLTFASTLADAIRHLVTSGAEFGTYNVTNDGEPMSWREIAAEVFALLGRDRDDVIGVSTEEYFAGPLAEGKPVSPRPLQSTLDLSKIKAIGFQPDDQLGALRAYLGQ